jgi:1,4-dihydroxy-2-naphthoyl-CoA hydrolase
MSTGIAPRPELGPWTVEDVAQAPRRGFQKTLGLELLKIGRRRLAAELNLNSHHANSAGLVHGGVLMSLGDSLGGLGALQNLAPGQATATLESKTNFLRPAQGPTLHADCRALHIGSRTSVWQTTIRSQRKIVAIITQTQLHYTPGPSRHPSSRRPPGAPSAHRKIGHPE